MRKFHVPAHFRSFPSVVSGLAGAGCSLGPGMEGLKPALARPGHGLVAGGLGVGFCFSRTQPDISGHWVPACAGVAVGCGNFLCPAHFRSFPLISERCIHSGGGRLFAGAWDGGVETCSCKAGTRLGGCRPWVRILFLAGTTRLIRTSGLVSACAGVAVWCGNFFIPAYSRLFPLISERCIHSGGGRLFVGTWCRGGSESRPYLPGTRLGGCRPGG